MRRMKKARTISARHFCSPSAVRSFFCEYCKSRHPSMSTTMHHFFPMRRSRTSRDPVQSSSAIQSIHMVILTERSSGSEDCQAIADDFYDKKYPKEPNGVCFLIDMGQRQIVISTSGIMQYYMSDAEIDDILQAAQGYAKDGDYAGTFAKMITMTQECFDRGVSDADYLITEDGSIIHYRKINSTEALIAVIAAAATGILVYFGIWKSYRRKKNRGAKSYADLKRVKIRDRRDALIDRHVSMHKIQKDDGNHGGGVSGGGGGGGSTVHTSSSGNSHGGGSIGF